MTIGTTIERDQADSSGQLGSRLQLQQNIGRSGILFLALFGSIFTWQFQTHQNRPVSGLCNNHRIGSSCALDEIGLSTGNLQMPNASTVTPLVDFNESAKGGHIGRERDDNLNYLNSFNTTPKDRKEGSYLLYFSESGWANQEICMEHAYYFARALNRTLILPPVLPHLGKGSLAARDVFVMDTTHFKTAVDPLKFYVTKLPREKYVPIHDVFDINFSFPDVTVIDALDFSSMLTSHNMTRWVVESHYSHYNTRWILNQSQIEGEVIFLTRQEYGRTVDLYMTNRDIVTTLADYTDDIVVFLDGFKSVFDESSSTPSFQPRMSEHIRTLVQTVRERWNVPAYGAVHIRGGDGWFAEEHKLQETIVVAMNNITDQILAWLNGAGDGETSVGLYVATDVRDLFNHTVMAQEVVAMVERIQNATNPSVIVDFLSGEELSNKFQIRSDLRYSNIFLDLQMAVCATVGFVGTEGSTFSYSIQKHRHKSSC